MLPITPIQTNLNLTALLLTAVFACTLSGCGDSNRNQLIGKWGIAAPQAVMKRIDQVQPSNELPTETEIAERMTITFKRNGVLNTRTRMGEIDQEKTGTWKMISFDQPSSLMTISCEINLQTSEHEITFVDENTIKLVPPNMAGLKMKLKFSKFNGQ